MRVGVLTAGGDCPGLNAVIRASVRRLSELGHEPVGLERGFEGLAGGSRRSLDNGAVSGTLHVGGTILSTSGYDPFFEEDGVERVQTAQRDDPLDGVIAIGGEHTMEVARRLTEELELPVVGVPKTIDNDVPQTDYTFGFDTAVYVATEAIDRLHSTAESHDRVMVLEVMGRETGWIALFAGVAGGADGILIPELELTVEDLAGFVESRRARGKDFSVIVVAEGAKLAFADGESRDAKATDETDAYGYARLGGIGRAVAAELEERTGCESRTTELGHLQRGGTPTPADRVLATRYGIRAAELAHEERFGEMAALRGAEMTSVPLADVRGRKSVDLGFLEMARTFFG